MDRSATLLASSSSYHRGIGARGRLQIQTVRGETNTFSDESDPWRGGTARAQIDETRQARTGRADRMDQRIVIGLTDRHVRARTEAAPQPNRK